MRSRAGAKLVFFTLIARGHLSANQFLAGHHWDPPYTNLIQRDAVIHVMYAVYLTTFLPAENSQSQTFMEAFTICFVPTIVIHK